MKTLSTTLVAMLLASISLCAGAQVPQYGPNVTLEQARKALAAASAEARKNGWPMAIAIVDTAGQLVAYERMDNTQTGSVTLSQEKAQTAAMFRRSTKVLQDVVAGGGAGVRYLAVRGMTPVEGGIPLEKDGKMIGAIGVSGMASDQDGVIAKAGADAVK